MSTSEDSDLKTAVPDLRDIPPDRLDKLGGTVLANAIRECLAGGGTTPPKAFEFQHLSVSA